MPVVLKNLSKEMQIFDLPHESVCTGEADDCLCVDETIRVSSLDPASGEKGVRVVEKTINDSLHLAPGCESRSLPDKVKDVPAIKTALTRKVLAEVVTAKVPPSDSEKSEDKKVKKTA